MGLYLQYCQGLKCYLAHSKDSIQAIQNALAMEGRPKTVALRPSEHTNNVKYADSCPIPGDAKANGPMISP